MESDFTRIRFARSRTRLPVAANTALQGAGHGRGTPGLPSTAISESPSTGRPTPFTLKYAIKSCCSVSAGDAVPYCNARVGRAAIRDGRRFHGRSAFYVLHAMVGENVILIYNDVEEFQCTLSL